MKIFCRKGISTFCLPLTLLFAAPIWAENTALSFEQATLRLYQQSDALNAAKSQREQKAAIAQASKSLHYPEVYLDAKYLRFRKSLELPLGSLAPVANAFGISSPLEFEVEDNRFRPILNAVLPIYMGGQISAAKKASEASVKVAEAEFLQTKQGLLLQLVQAYFGQQLAEQTLKIRVEVKEGLALHLAQAEKLEREGFATKAQRLQAQVAFDQAQREQYAAATQYYNAAMVLASLLRSEEAILPRTSLFVISKKLEPLQYYLDSAIAHHPSLQRFHALEEQSVQAVKAEKSQWQPQIYAFGQYDLYQQDALITDSDWAIGFGLRYTLFSNQNRSSRVSAAQYQQYQAEYGAKEAQVQLQMAVSQAYSSLESVRQQFFLMQSSIEQAEENLRLQSLSFSEGQATSLDVIDARLQLAKATIERVSLAYQFDMLLAQLLYASGQSENFLDYLTLADTVIDHDK